MWRLNLWGTQMCIEFHYLFQNFQHNIWCWRWNKVIVDVIVIEHRGTMNVSSCWDVSLWTSLRPRSQAANAAKVSEVNSTYFLCLSKLHPYLQLLVFTHFPIVTASLVQCLPLPHPSVPVFFSSLGRLLMHERMDQQLSSHKHKAGLTFNSLWKEVSFPPGLTNTEKVFLHPIEKQYCCSCTFSFYCKFCQTSCWLWESSVLDVLYHLFFSQTWQRLHITSPSGVWSTPWSPGMQHLNFFFFKRH